MQAISPVACLVAPQVVQAEEELHALLVQHSDGHGEESVASLHLNQMDATCRRRHGWAMD